MALYSFSFFPLFFHTPVFNTFRSTRAHTTDAHFYALGAQHTTLHYYVTVRDVNVRNHIVGRQMYIILYYYNIKPIKILFTILIIVIDQFDRTG